MASTAAMAAVSPPLPAFSPVYFGEDNDDMDNSSDFCATSSVVDASGVPDVDTIDNSNSHSAINPIARRILLGSDYDDDIIDNANETNEISRRKIPLGVPPPLDDDDDNWQRDSEHSLPDPEDLKLSFAASAAAGGASSLSLLFSSSNRKKIIYPALSIILSLVVVLFFIFGAIAGVNHKNATTTTQTQNEQQNKNSNYDDLDTFFGGDPNNGEVHGRRTHLENYMVKYGITAPDQFYKEGESTMNTPQSQAIRWLANEDNRFPTLPTHDTDPTISPDGYALVSRYALAVFYFSTEGKNWDNSLGFLDSDKATCDWYHIFAAPKGELGVLCDLTTRDIIGLSLINNNIRGTIPSELSQLTSLEYIESIDNPLTGTIPIECQKLTAMRTFAISFNQLTGKLPSWMPQSWPELEFMYLSNNLFSGTIPDQFFEFQKLSVLALDDNILTGKTDIIWNSMPSLEYLYLEDNDFTGTLPASLLSSNFNSALVTLDISSNRLTGALPNDIFQLSRLEILDMHYNRFDSIIPGNIPENNERLKFVALQSNILNGTIPSTIANLQHLSHLDVTSNRLTGTIPKEMERLSDTISYLFLGANDYKEGPIPSLVYALTNLRELSLKSSKRTGSIAGVIGALDSILVLDLDDNRLTGSIPNEIGMLTNLQFLLLNRNQLTSLVPGDSLTQLEKLRFLLLDNNHLFGDLNPICGLENLNTVYIDCGEIACLEGCCNCCTDGQACHDNALISSQDPVWESGYTRQFFDFSEGDGGRFYSNRDDDYWQ